jgi:hypothetical protein
MISLARQDKKKLIHAADFMDIVEKNTELDEQLLETHGDLVYNCDRKEIVAMVRKFHAGKTLNL